MAPSTREPRGVTLACHPDTPSEAIRGIAARVRRNQDGTLAVAYVIEGDLARMKIPAPAPTSASRGEPLWRHTCCEIFIARQGEAAYHEFNFAPSGAWAAYAFARYRQSAPSAGGPPDPTLVHGLSSHTTGSRLELHASICLDRLSPSHAVAKLALAVSTVIEDRDGGLSYWALTHPSGKPDFHHPDAFTLRLDELRD
jgi:hypothetical protein